LATLCQQTRLTLAAGARAPTLIVPWALVPMRLRPKRFGAAADETCRSEGIGILGILSRLWIPMVISAVVVAGGLVVYRVHGYFGSHKRESYADGKHESPKLFNPKLISYEVFGASGTVADISYFDVNSDPQRVDGARLPWLLHITGTEPAVGSLMAQGNSDSIGCRITINGEVEAEQVSNEVNAYTFCLVKSA
jgi:hypothetical protein